MQRDQRKLAAIVCADVVGYSRLMGRDESGTLAALRAHMRELIEPAIEEHHGRLVKTTGDGLLVEFASVVDAVRCSVAIQRGMSLRNAGIPPDRRMDFRFGINVGDVISEGDDIFGDGVNIAARLEGIADPGGICVSRAVRDQVRDKLSFSFEDLGPRQVKNIERPLEVYRVRDDATLQDPSELAARGPTAVKPSSGHARLAWASVIVVSLLGGAAWYLAQAPKVAPPRDDAPAMSLAVLRFTDAGGATANGLQAQRLHLDLAAVLERRNRQAIVVSPGMVERYAGTRVDARQLGRELNVRYLVEGEVDRSGGTSVTARLVEATKGTQLWSAKVDASGTQAAIVSQLAEGVRRALYDAERKRAAQLPGPAASAMEMTLQADQLIASDGPGDLEKAQALYREALRHDPKLLPALSGLYFCIMQLELPDPGANFDAAVAKMDELSLRALNADRDDPRAWRLRTNALLWQWQWRGAFEANDQALRLDPSHSETLRQRAELLIRTGRADEALGVLDRAIALDPAGPGIPNILGTQCWANQQLGRYEAAVASCERAVALGAGFVINYVAAAAASAHLGDMDKARRFKALALAKDPKLSIAYIKAWPTSNDPDYLRQVEQHLYAGLRKLGFPEG